MKRNSIICLLANLLAFWAGAQTPQTPGYDVSVTTITVWVKAIDDSGKPVEGMTAADFDVYEDKQKVNLNCFEEVKQPEGIAPSDSKQAQDFRQKFAIYLDLLNTSSNELTAIRPQLKDFLARIAVRKPEVMLAALLPTQRLGIVSPFTTDLKRISGLLDKAPGNSTRDATEITRRDQMRHVMEGAGGELIDAIRDGYKLADDFAEQDQQRSEFTLSALESFASHLATQNFGDHVVVIYISGGFSSDPGRQYFDMVDDLSSNAASNEEMQAVMYHRRPNFDFQKELQKSVGKLNRYNVTISTLDTQGMESTGEYRDSLVEMAQETGGISFVNSRNFGEGLDRVLTDLKHQYILCYSQPPHPKQGEYHAIKVVCKRPGVRVRHRDGYLD